jgi:hypothetical protein
VIAVKRLFVLVLLGLSGLSVFADETWEPSDIHPISAGSSILAEPHGRLFEGTALSLISFYQTKISPLTIIRCPFLVSCSTFAARAIADKGLALGLAIFIDRYYYRENTTAFRLYRLVRTEGDILKIDDSEYLK